LLVMTLNWALVRLIRLWALRSINSKEVNRRYGKKTRGCEV